MKKRIVYLFLVLALAVMMVPAVASADVVPIQVGNFGFIPNSGEASVTKVDLPNATVAATYYTAPRLGEVTPDVPPYAWRTSRIAMDIAGNAWVLNVGADAYLQGYALGDPMPDNFGTYIYPNATNDLVGQAVRIQGNTIGLANTSTGAALPFGTDDAVLVFDVGDAGQMPRAIAIEADNDIWIGFYAGKYFQKYTFNDALDTFSASGDPVPGNFTPYDAMIVGDTLYFTSRDANPALPVLGDTGVYYFDVDTPGTPTRIDLGLNPYDLLVGDGVIWATALDGNLYKIEAGPVVTTIPIEEGAGLRGLSFDGAGNILLAGSSLNKVYRYHPVGGAIESTTAIAGAVIVGAGIDADGNVWAICRNDNMAGDPGFIVKFDPTTLAQLDSVDVGFRPYAYGDFVTTATIGIQIVKYVSVDGDSALLPPAGPWNDANDPQGPTADIGETVYFLYVVTNTGDLPLADVVVKDDNETPGIPGDDFNPTPVDVNADTFNDGDTNKDNKLDVDEVWLYKSNEVATAGQHTNIADVIGWYPDDSGTSVTDDDPANYYCTEDFEGCTPGFWKNNGEKHSASAWVGYTINQKFSVVFDVTPFTIKNEKKVDIYDPTLLQALGANGGGINALARHAVAALLSAANPLINYHIEPASAVITAVHNAIMHGGDIGALADDLADYNEAGCVINQQGQLSEGD